MDGFKSFNINEEIKVKLTPYGVGFLPHTAYRPDSEGFYHFQLHSFMAIFGDHIFNGGPNVTVDCKIFLPTKHLKEVT